MRASPLSGHLRDLIGAEGPLPVDRYMEEALLHPQHGYYTTREPFGCAGDFITAPEISQVFGELIGLWCAAIWQQLGSPARIALVEFGPGRGTLIIDALRAAKVLPEFRAALSVFLVEASPRLRDIQRQTLSGVEVSWLDDVDALPEGPLILIGNEFFDALPIRQLIYRGGSWRERCVTWGDERLAWTERAADSSLLRHIPSVCGTASEGDIFEFSDTSHKIMARLSRHIADQGGAGLFIDYGHGRSAFGDTFQAMRAHHYADVLDAPGTADLTAHVDFDALLRAAAPSGCACFGPVTQRQFLTALGLNERASMLQRNATKTQATALRTGARRLIEPTEMGTLFKAIAIASPGMAALPGFAAPRGPATADEEPREGDPA